MGEGHHGDKDKGIFSHLVHGYPPAGYPPPPGAYPPHQGYPPGPYPPPGYGYPPAAGYPPPPPAGAHGYPSMGAGMGLLAGGAAAAAAAYGAHRVSHGGYYGHMPYGQYGHMPHGKFKHGKFKHGKFKHGKHGMFRKWK